MYATCLFCRGPLGANAALEAFPVGRRLAYDADKGRLWVVCPRCERWNLTPLEERWEAIEQAERLYRGTRLRASTDNVGLARVAGDTELVRIGRPPRPEMAAWRYGDQFGRRRRRTLAGAGVATVAAGGVALLAPAGMLGGLLVGFAWPAVLASFVAATQGLGQGALFDRRWLDDGQGGHVLISRNELPFVRLVAGGADGWQLRLPFLRAAARPDVQWRDALKIPAAQEVTLEGPAAAAAARVLLPLVNGSGAGAARVREAVSLLDTLGGPDVAFARAAGRVREWGARQVLGDTGALLHLPAEARLALEMAAHEAQERRALEGELGALEAAWRDAEAIAAIADDLLLPEAVTERLAVLRGRRAAASGPDGPSAHA
jgi:hypothetical protein